MNRKIDTSLNNADFFFLKISIVAHSIFYNTLTKKGVFAYLHDFEVHLPHMEYTYAYLFFSPILRFEKKSKTKPNKTLTHHKHELT